MKKISDNSVQIKYLEGISKLASAVGSTLGPRGRTVVLKNNNNIVITKDGVTVTKFLDLEDPFENLAVQILKEASIKTSTEAGDGTTTTIILAEAFYRNAINLLSIQKNINPVILKRKLEEILEKFLDVISENSLPVSDEEDLKNIATISANNDEHLGQLVAQAFSIAGSDGAIKIDTNNSEDSIDVTEGYQLMGGYITSVFINNNLKHLVEYDNCLVAITDETIESVEQLFGALQIAAAAKMPLVVVANSVEDQALAAMVLNTKQKNMPLVAIAAPKYFSSQYEILQDLATVLGGTVMNPINSKPFSQITLNDMGKCAKAIIGKNNSIFISGLSSRKDIETRVELLQSQMTENSDLEEISQLQERISKLSSCVVTIKIGAPTEIERKEKYYRVEDAVEAVKSAIQDGILPGGGVSAIKLFGKIKKPKDPLSYEHIAYNIFYDSVREPLKVMLQNAGEEGYESIIKNIMKSKVLSYGYDIYKEKYCSMLEAGIIDPVKVLRSSLINAISVATTLLTSKYAIIET
jgi:chaperonin GroEL